MPRSSRFENIFYFIISADNLWPMNFREDERSARRVEILHARSGVESFSHFVPPDSLPFVRLENLSRGWLGSHWFQSFSSFDPQLRGADFSLPDSLRG